MHLTNYSVQKHYSGYGMNINGKSSKNNNTSSKWGLQQLFEYFSQNNKNEKFSVESFQSKIDNLIVNTILSCQKSVVIKMREAQCKWNQCFELLGFDIILDNDFNPWLLEVNSLPSLSSSSPFDKQIKFCVCVFVLHKIIKVKSDNYIKLSFV